jgi:Family of unknown function (DUF6335)
MAKRRAKTGARKAGRTTSKKAARRGARPARKASARKAARPAARAARKPMKKKPRKAATASRKAAPARTARAAPKRTVKRAATRKTASQASSRPKPVALSRERRQLRDDATLPGAPSSLNFAAKASAAESGHQMYHQRAKEHTEGGQTLTGGDVDSDWNGAYSSGEETPGGDMSTPDQDVVEEIGRALGVEYEDAEELKGAEKIESRDRNRWEYDPASAEDYKDRNRRDD